MFFFPPHLEADDLTAMNLLLATVKLIGVVFSYECQHCSFVSFQLFIYFFKLCASYFLSS